MDTEGINKSISSLVVNLSFKADYYSFLEEDKKLLIVEGQTDKRFIEEYLNDDVICIIANKAFGSKSGFEQDIRNYKKAIVQVVYGLSKIPVLLKMPKELENKAVYGMVDLDYDNPSSPELSVQRLFVTDTHDLETMIISSDDGILQRIKDCVIPSDDVQKALYLAYQIGISRNVLFDVSDSDFELKTIAGGNGQEIDYAYFVENYEINVRKLVKYINLKSDNPVSSTKEKKIADKAISDRRLKKRLNKEGIWNTTWEKFSPYEIEDCWVVVNGHDFLSLLRYINLDVSNRYSEPNINSLNRKFEMDLIENYDFKKFSKTRMHKKMMAEQVISE